MSRCRPALTAHSMIATVIHRCAIFLYIIFFFFLIIRRPPRSTLDRSSAASDVYKRQDFDPARQVVVEGGDALAGRPGAATAATVANGLDAVSYTHLRAHETVLDLVCRLLLEKKKNQNSYADSTHNYDVVPLDRLLIDDTMSTT